MAPRRPTAGAENVEPVVGRLRADGLPEGAVVLDAKPPPLLAQRHLRVARRRRPRLVGVFDAEGASSARWRRLADGAPHAIAAES